MSELSRRVGGLVAEEVSNRRHELDRLADELRAQAGVDAGEAVGALARDLIAGYVGDRALIEATKLIDAEGDIDRELESFRDSLVYSLGLTVAALLLDRGGRPAREPMDAKPQALFDVLERAYGLFS